MKIRVHFLLTCLLGLLIMSCDDSTSELAKDEINSSPSYTIENNILSFSSKEAMFNLLAELSAMSFEDYQEWCINNEFNSSRLAFEKLINEEAQINEFYLNKLEESPEFQLPEEEVHSPLYNKLLDNGVIANIYDSDGSYYDYNFRNAQMASILNENRQVVVGDELYQYGLDTFVRISEKGSGIKKNISYGFIEADPVNRTEVENPDHAWLFSGNPDNGWSKNNDRRYRVWMEGSSKIFYGIRVREVTNVFRAQTQKKNIWGNWKFDGSKNIEITGGELKVKEGTWWEDTQDIYSPNSTLPLISSTPPVYLVGYSNPFYWSNSVNNLTLQIWPHNFGIYRSTGWSDSYNGILMPDDSYLFNWSIDYGPFTFSLNKHNNPNY